MKKKLLICFLFFILSLIIIFGTSLFVSNESTSQLGFYINSSSLENGESIEILKLGKRSSKVRFNDGTTLYVDSKNLVSFDTLFEEREDIVLVTKNDFLLNGISSDLRSDIRIYKGTYLTRTYEGEKYSCIRYGEDVFYVDNSSISNVPIIDSSKDDLYILEDLVLFEYASEDSDNLTTLRKLSKVKFLYELDDFMFVEASGFFGYIKNTKLYSYKDIFKTTNEDIFLEEAKELFDAPSFESSINISFSKGSKLNVVGKYNDIYAINYDDKICYINGLNTKSASKIFSYVNDEVIVKEMATIYSTMSREGQSLFIADKGVVFTRLYRGNNGFDIIVIGNTIGYIGSNYVETYKNYSVEEKSMYVLNDVNLYNSSTLSTKLETIKKGEIVSIVEELPNRLVKVKYGDLVGYMELKYLSSPENTFTSCNKIMYAKEDVSFTYIENGKEEILVIPKGMFVVVEKESLLGIVQVKYNDHSGLLNESLLDVNPPKVEVVIVDTSLKDDDTKENTSSNSSAPSTSTSSYTDYYLKSYKSSTLEIVIERLYKNSCVYWVCEIKTSNPASQLKTSLSYDTYAGKRETVSSFTKRQNGILGINGSGFFYEDGTIFGNIVIKNGEMIKDGYGERHIMCIDENGKIFSAPDPSTAEQLLNMGVKNTFGFGPMLIIDGEYVYETAGDPDSGYQPRTAIGMVEPGHYIIVVADGRRSYTKGMRISQLASIFGDYNCEYAYNLDGGGSSCLYFNGEVLNRPSDGNERPCADGIYFIN